MVTISSWWSHLSGVLYRSQSLLSLPNLVGAELLGNVDGLKSLLISIHILCIILVVSRQFLMLLVGVLTMLQLLVPLWLSLPFFGSVSKFTFEEPDKEMADLIVLARSHASNFCIIEAFCFACCG